MAEATKWMLSRPIVPDAHMRIPAEANRRAFMKPANRTFSCQ